MLINNITVYCLPPTDVCELYRIFCKFTVSAYMNGNVEIHVLFEKLTATVVLNFMRCHLNTIDNCHVITIHIQNSRFGINFNVDSN